MKGSFSSRERLLAALENRESDYVPCSFMSFKALRENCKNQIEFINQELELGLDPKVELPEIPIRFHSDVKVKEWKEESPEKPYPLLHKEYHTPSGTLTTVVKKTRDWPYGDHIPFLDDYLIPRSEKFLVNSKDDLKSLRFLFSEPTREDILGFREESAKLKKFASDKDLLISGGWKTGTDPGCMGIDAAMWLCGMQETIQLAIDEPELIEELVWIISNWNTRQMEIVLDEGVDLLIRRAWYESSDLWSPSLYRKYMVPVLQKEIELAHQAGTKFGYIMTSGVAPLLKDFLKLGFDVLIGVDPIQGKGTNLKLLKENLGGKICLWGGVNGFLTVERGNEQEIRQAVRKAINILGSERGFILSPVDNVRDTSNHTWHNVMTMIESWKEIR